MDEAIGFVTHKGWEHRPAERMCQQIFGLSTTTSQPAKVALLTRIVGGGWVVGGMPGAPLLH